MTARLNEAVEPSDVKQGQEAEEPGEAQASQASQHRRYSFFAGRYSFASSVPTSDQVDMGKGRRLAADHLASAELEDSAQPRTLSTRLSLIIVHAVAEGQASIRRSIEAYDVILGTDHVDYTHSEPDSEVQGLTRQVRSRLHLIDVTAVAAMNDPSAWTLFVEDGATYEFRAETAETRQAWVNAICDRLRANDSPQGAW